ncbi:MAG: sulfotransferase [Bacteroidota bacterium]
MADHQILIHVGMAKAASTFLQKEVFSRGDFGFYYDDRKRLDFYQQVLPQITPYYQRESCLSYLEKELLSPAHNEKLLPVWSNELLSGWPSYGSYNRVLLANRLHELFPDAKILLIIREQKAAIASVYGQYIREGGTMSLKNYLTQNWVAPYFHGFNLEQYDYAKMLELYGDLFGPENVLCLPYEMLYAKTEDFFSRFNEFLHVSVDTQKLAVSKKVNRSPSHGHLWMKKHLGKLINNRRSVSNQNALLYTRQIVRLWPLLQLPGFVDRKIEKDKARVIDAFVGDTFKQSNASVEKSLGLALKPLGYQL